MFVAEVILRYANFSVPVAAGFLEQDAQREAVGLSEQATCLAPMAPAADDGAEPEPWRLTADQQQKAARLFQAGGSVTEVARVTGMAFSRARTVLEERSLIAPGERLDAWHQLTPDEVREVGGLRELGWSYRRIGEKFGVSRTTVTNRLRAMLEIVDNQSYDGVDEWASRPTMKDFHLPESTRELLSTMAEDTRASERNLIIGAVALLAYALAQTTDGQRCVLAEQTRDPRIIGITTLRPELIVVPRDALLAAPFYTLSFPIDSPDDPPRLRLV